MLEKYGIRRNRQVRFYTAEEYDPQYENHDVANAIYAALHHFNAKEYALAKRAADIASNTQQGPLAKFISGISSYKLGDTKPAIKQLTEFCMALPDRTFVKNPTALWNIGEEILVRLVGNQIAYLLGEESREKEYFADIMPGLVEFTDTDELDFRFTSQLSYQTQLKLIEYLHLNKKIDEDIYLRERNYILACMTQSKGLDLKAVAELISEATQGNSKAQEAIGRIVNFENKDFTPDRYLYYKTIEIMHANKVMDTETYINRLMKLKSDLEAKLRNEAELQALRAQLPQPSDDTSVAPTDELSQASSGVSVDFEDSSSHSKPSLSLNLTAVVPSAEIVELPIACDTQKLIDTINRQILRHGVAHLFIKEKEKQFKETKDPSLCFNTLQHKHANGLMSTESYITELLDLSAKLESDEKILQFSNESTSSSEDENIAPVFDIDPTVKKRLLDEINYQIFIHNKSRDSDRDENYVTSFQGKESVTTLKERVLAKNVIYNYSVEKKLQKLAKASIDSTLKEELAEKKKIVETFSEGKKTAAVKERVLGQNIIANYYKDVWNTLALSETTPLLLKVLFFIPKALITGLSTAYLPVHAVKTKMTSVGTKLQESSQAAIDSIHRAESDLKNKWHAFFRAKLPPPQRDVVRATVRPVR